MHEYIAAKYPSVVSKHSKVIDLLEKQVTIGMVVAATGKTVDEYRVEIEKMKAWRPRMQMVVYVVEDGELPSDVFMHAAELDPAADSPYRQSMVNEATLRELLNLPDMGLPILIACTAESTLMVGGVSFPAYQSDLRSVFATLFARSYRLRAPTVLDIYAENIDFTLLRLLYYYASMLFMVNAPTYDRYFSCMLRLPPSTTLNTSAADSILSVDGLVASLSSGENGRKRAVDIVSFVRSYLMVAGDKQLRRLSYPLAPAMEADAIDEAIKVLSTASILREGLLASKDEAGEIELLERMAEIIEPIDDDEYWTSIVGMLHPPSSEDTPLSPALIQGMAAAKITTGSDGPPAGGVREFASIPRGDYGFPILDCDRELESGRTVMADTAPALWVEIAAEPKAPLPAGTSDLPLAVQYPGITHAKVMQDRYEGLRAFEAFVTSIYPVILQLPPLPTAMPPFYARRYAYAPLNKDFMGIVDNIERIRLTTHKGPYVMPPPIMRLHRSSKGNFTLFFVPVARTLSVVPNVGLQAVSPALNIGPESVRVLDAEKNEPVSGVIQFIPSAMAGQQSMRYDAVVAAFEYRPSQARNEIINYIKPIYAYYRAVLGLIAAKSQTWVGTTPEEGRVLFMRSAKSDASVTILTQRLIAIEKATSFEEAGDERPLTANEKAFYAKYENCTADPYETKAMFRVLGAKNWNDWGVRFCTLLTATTFSPAGAPDQSAADLAKSSKNEMLNRVYFMKKPWPQLMEQPTIPLVFLRYMGVVDYARAGGLSIIIGAMKTHELLVSELAYLFGPPEELPAVGMGRDAIRLFFDSPKERIERYLDGLASRLPHCPSCYVHPTTYIMMVRLPHSLRVGVPILVGTYAN
jgi:hypothetical protein